MIKLRLLMLCFVLLAGNGYSQTVNVSFAVDTSDVRIRKAISFLKGYLREFAAKKTPDYTKYWSDEDCRRSILPDDMVYAISSDGPTYRFSSNPTIFFAKIEDKVVHLKTLLASSDSSGYIIIWAITNHYIRREGNQLRFVSEVCLHKNKYRRKKNGNITYHYMAGNSFDIKNSNEMLKRLGKIQGDWGFKPVPVDYYYASNEVELARMRGFDYLFGEDGMHPSGNTEVAEKTIYCQGLGEAYLHEVLHIYFNPLFGKSPLCHGLIYYMAGGLGKDFNWMINRMNEYLVKYPETDIARFDTLVSKDILLHIDNTITGLLCKMIYEKEGILALRRALKYTTVDELLKNEFGISVGEKATFLRAAIARYAGAG